MGRVTLWIGTVLVGTALLAGCGSAKPAADNPTGVGVAGNDTGTAPANSPAANTPSANDGSGSAPPAANTGELGQTSTPGNSTEPGPTTAAQSLVRESMQLAQRGEVIDVPFAVTQDMGTVEAAWGKATSQSSAGAGQYASYGRHAVAFGFNKGEQIFDVRSYSSKLQAITKSDVQSVLGQPGETRETSDSVIYMYPAGADYQLLWVFPKTGSTNHVDHVSVFWPQGTINTMALNFPAPSVVVDSAPGSVGRLFTFSIQNPPKGYWLVELEWIPTHNGQPLVNTVSQALQNGQRGGGVTGFSISGDGQTSSFVYAPTDAGVSGQVRLIFQNTAGSAVIGTSPTVTLR
ncbi:hypothetical protein GCM10025857_23390 [Alicyclobacillus contaminans]|uniref:DUF4309 domain-containing protein n=1 Tax=Alicyclobacillus contaminans TaxID=392016 RepID=UPI0006862A59|nr:DUF4309 domain-containing protein [Alicyclobacillus contaminans]GMA50982.1 hypothetical protein GCM10025857_23390 [Alicyclobacillus contaminans]